MFGVTTSLLMLQIIPITKPNYILYIFLCFRYVLYLEGHYFPPTQAVLTVYPLLIFIATFLLMITVYVVSLLYVYPSMR